MTCLASQLLNQIQNKPIYLSYMQKFTLSARLLMLFAQDKGIRTVASLFREKINISELPRRLTRGKYQKIMSKTADY